MLAAVHAFAAFEVDDLAMSNPLPHEQNEVKAISNKKRQSHQP